jgi:hypothetical protein
MHHRSQRLAGAFRPGLELDDFLGLTRIAHRVLVLALVPNNGFTGEVNCEIGTGFLVCFAARAQKERFLGHSARTVHADSRRLPCGTLFLLQEQGRRHFRHDHAGLANGPYETVDRRQDLLEKRPPRPGLADMEPDAAHARLHYRAHLPQSLS